MEANVLIVDDEFSIRESFNLILSSKYHVFQAASGEGALKYTADNPPDLVYLDIRMPGMDGIEALRKIKEISPQTEVIMVTAVNDVQKASQAVTLGAYDYIVKPFDVDKILNLTDEVIRRSRLYKTAKEISAGATPRLPGRSEKIVRISQKIEEISKSSDSVLLIGEPGVEKEWIAALIYEQSRGAGSFKTIDAQGKSYNLLQRKLFGESEGTTTADIRREGGVMKGACALFIDNVENLPRQIQVKLTEAPLRLICGTTLNLSQSDIESKLWEKLSKNIIDIPPLRERAPDIPFLIEHFISQAKIELNGKASNMLPAAQDALTAYSWPGNVLELKAVIENLVLVSGNAPIDVSDLPISILLSLSVLPFEEVYGGFEKDFINRVLELFKDKEKTARALRINHQALLAKLS